MIEFKPLSGCNYSHNYVKIFYAIKRKTLDARSVYRELILNDLFFIVYFILEIPGANHPFVVRACQEVENGPKDFTLDIWSREHFKSSIITIAETLQFSLKHPNETTAIYSATRLLAKKFLFQLKDLFENKRILYECFPDVVWENPKSDAPVWSLDDGLILRRSTNSKEVNISAWGLVEGMPTGFHFSRRIYDDITKDDLVETVGMMDKVKEKYDLSLFTGKQGGTHRVVGTIYHYDDALIYIRSKKDAVTDEPEYYERVKPGTDNGQRNGIPVLFTQNYLDSLKTSRSFNIQILCDPAPGTDRVFNVDFFGIVPVEKLPPAGKMFKFMVVDSAGDKKEGKGDPWAIGLFGVVPPGEKEEVGTSDVYLLDLVLDQLSEAQAPTIITQMYIKGGKVLQMGVEKVSQSTTEIHVSRELEIYKIRLTVELKNLIILTPKGRNKHKRIESALLWPLVNGKLHMSEGVPEKYRTLLLKQFDKFPYWHDDGPDMWSYLYDMLVDFKFPSTESLPKPGKPRMNIYNHRLRSKRQRSASVYGVGGGR